MFQKNNPIPGSRSLQCESRGLEELRKFQKQHGLKLPKVIEQSKERLLLEKIVSVAPTDADWRALGEGLAKVHRIENDLFGFEEDNFIGLNEQKNPQEDDWGHFFIYQRLYYQIHLISSSEVKNEFLQIIASIEDKLYTFLNQHEPKASLLHGDLWSGNIMFSSDGPYLIDPAVYYGDRETDLAMTKLFGGFDPVFYEAYQSEYPLSQHYKIRENIYNLYHYLNHYNLFGVTYLAKSRLILKELALSFL